MTDHAAALIAAGLCFGPGVIGSGAGLGILIGHAIDSMVRQPAMQNTVRTTMFIGIGIVEALALYAIVFGLIMLFVIKAPG
jgi:F-type H+-transporting ATPase subunit c